jgi:hypothetical protein
MTGTDDSAITRVLAMPGAVSADRICCSWSENAEGPPPMSDAMSIPTPEYRLSVKTEGDTLIVQVSGEVDAQYVRIAYWTEIVAIAHAHGCRKLLVTDRKKGSPASPAELVELAQLFTEEGEYFERVAVIEPNPTFMPAIEHAEIFARAAGINVRIFADVKSATHWLYYGSADD